MDFENKLNRLQEMMNLRNSNKDPLVDLYDLKGSDKGDNMIDSLTMEPSDTFLMGDESEVISDSVLECDMPATTPLPTIDVREEVFDINSPLGEYVVDLLMENEDVTGFPRHLVKYLFNHLLKNPSLTKGMSDKPLGDDSKSISYDVIFSNPLFDFNDDFTLCKDNPLFDEEFEDINIDLPLGEPLDTLSTGDREIDFNPSNSDSMSRSSETSDLFEELTAEFGLDDSIPTNIDDRIPFDLEDLRACFQSSNHAVSDHLHVYIL
ncbi:hypothetical protein Tco_1395680 [Tanacetum coccineum]